MVDPATEMAPKLSSDVIEKLVFDISNGSAADTCGRFGGNAKGEACTGVSGCEGPVGSAVQVDEESGVPFDVVMDGKSDVWMCMGAVLLARVVEVRSGRFVGASAFVARPFGLFGDARRLLASDDLERENMLGKQGRVENYAGPLSFFLSRDTR